MFILWFLTNAFSGENWADDYVKLGLMVLAITFLANTLPPDAAF